MISQEAPLLLSDRQRPAAGVELFLVEDEGILFDQIGQAEQLPPDDLLLPAMEVEELSEQPAGLLLRRALGRVDRYVLEQSRSDRFDLLEGLAEALAGLRRSGLRPPLFGHVRRESL